MTDVISIGPECFASVDESVISWRGRNYVPQLTDHEVTEHDTLADVDVNDYTSTTTYGIFNDPQLWEPRFVSNGGPIADTLREVILETPIYEDASPGRTLRHAKLTNEDRRRNGTLARDGMVLIKRRVRLESPWILDTSDAGEPE